MHCQSQNEFNVRANNMNSMTFSNFSFKSIIFLIDMEFELLWWTFKKRRYMYVQEILQVDFQKLFRIVSLLDY